MSRLVYGCGGRVLASGRGDGGIQLRVAAAFRGQGVGLVQVPTRSNARQTQPGGASSADSGPIGDPDAGPGPGFDVGWGGAAWRDGLRWLASRERCRLEAPRLAAAVESLDLAVAQEAAPGVTPEGGERGGWARREATLFRLVLRASDASREVPPPRPVQKQNLILTSRAER